MKQVGFSIGLFCAVAMVGPLAQAQYEAGTPGEFLDFGVGGRAMGMGRTFTGIADDVDALYWNPGGLGTFRASQAAIQHSPLLEKGADQFLGLAQSVLTYGNVGVGIVNRTSRNVPRTDNNFIQTGDFDDRETAYLLGYGHQWGDHWGLGLTGKMVEHEIDEEKARGYGGDAGVLFQQEDIFRAGVMVRNLLPPSYSFDTDTEEFPRVGRFGMSYRFFRGHILAAADVEKHLVGGVTPKWHGGLEGSLVQPLAVRVGWSQGEVTGGIGVRWRSMGLDYSVGIQELGFFHRVGLKTTFGGFEVDVRASPARFSPIGLKNKTYIRLLCRSRQRVIRWYLSVRNAKNQVVRSYQGYDTPPDIVEWDGKDSQGRNAEPGVYRYQLTVRDKFDRLEKSRTRYLTIAAPTPLEIEMR